MVTRPRASRRVLRAISTTLHGCTRVRAIACAAAAIALTATCPALASPGHAKPHAGAARSAGELAPAIRGVTIGPIESSQQAGRGYGSPYSAALLDALVELGTNAISIT